MRVVKVCTKAGAGRSPVPPNYGLTKGVVLSIDTPEQTIAYSVTVNLTLAGCSTFSLEKENHNSNLMVEKGPN
jgi:hypothetical protein